MTPDPTPRPETSLSPAYRRGPHWVAVFAAVFTWPLIFVGGSVTTYRVGMAVPDWPTTFGINMFLYDFWNAPFGVRVEHTHRLYGAAVGVATIILAVWFLAAERRGSLKALGVLALLGVIAQGVLGGIRVRWNSTLLAAFHGVSGQAFFALMISLCVLTGKNWVQSAGAHVDPAHLRRRAAVTLFLVAVQIGLGTWLRHFANVPALWLHAIVAAAVWGHAAMLAWRVERHRREAPELVASGRAMTLAVTLQVVLGIAAWWMLRPFDGIPRTVTLFQAMVRTGHQANGALLLAASVVLTMRAFRNLAPVRAEERAPALKFDLEAVA
jgi:cytochrome c oxidase assembly protein subunit 15